MSFLYYFRECPTCKNASRNLVKEVFLHHDIQLDERYVFVLPDLWEKEANDISRTTGAPLPFLYNPETKQALNVDADRVDMREEIEAFIQTYS